MLESVLAQLPLPPVVLAALGVGSVLFFVASLLLTPVIITRLPADYFVRERPSTWRGDWRRKLRWLGRNVLGVILIFAGIAMLALPGQGLLTILLGVLLTTWPGRWRLLRRVVARPRVIKGLNRIRRRAGRLPFRRPAFGRHETPGAR